MNSRELLPGRIGALAGVAFVLLLFFSTTMLNVPSSVPDAELVDWWSDDANLTTVLVSTYLQIGAALCFLVFITALRGVSLRAEGGSGSLTTFAFAGGVLFAALLLVSDGPRGVIAIAVKLRDEPLPAVDLLRYMPQVGYVMIGTVGGAAAGVAVAANALLALRTSVLGRWLGVLGLICGIGTIALALVVGPFFIPVLLIWVVATSVALWRVKGVESVPATSTPVPGAALTR